MMFADRDYERTPILKFTSDSPVVTVQNWAERGYSVVNVQCKDRIKLLFDVVCNLTDMEYVVFHATINTNDDQAYLVIIQLPSIKFYGFSPSQYVACFMAVINVVVHIVISGILYQT